MPQSTIPYLQEGGRYYPLLTFGQELRLKAQAEDLKTAAEEYDREDLVEAATALRVQVRGVERELATNERLKSRGDVLRAVVAFKEPTLEDFGAFQASLGEPGKAREKAVELLAPAIEGMEAVPLRFYPLVADLCIAELNWNPSEDRRFFSIRWPSEPVDS